MKKFLSTRRGKLIAGIASLALLCLLCFCAFYLYSLTPGYQASATATAQAQLALATATAKARPTNTALPSATSAPSSTLLPSPSTAPSSTPRPSDTALPGAAPSATNTSHANETPHLTETRTLVASLTPTVSSLDALRQLAQQQFGTDFISATLTTETDQTTTAVVDYDLGDQWDENSAVLTTAENFRKFTPLVFATGKVDLLLLRSFANFTDAFGNTQKKVAISIPISRAVVERINWANFDSRNIRIVLSTDGLTVLVQPALRAAWDAYEK